MHCTLVAFTASVLLATVAAAQSTTRVSVDSAGLEGNASSTGWPAVSGDGRYIAFESTASNLVAGDTNGKYDVFVRDRQTGTTERMSVDSFGLEGNDTSFQPSISADGRYVAFYSESTNLVAGDTNGVQDIFVHDRGTGVTTRVSVGSGGVQGNNGSNEPSVSADGRYVAFESDADNLVPGDLNGQPDVFVHDNQTGMTTIVSLSVAGMQGDSQSSNPSITPDGRYVAFYSLATNLVPGDSNGVGDIFVRDLQQGTTERVSVSSVGAEANDYCWPGSISADGRRVVFWTAATGMVPGDTNGFQDVFVRDRQAGTTERVSVGSMGEQGNGHSQDTQISADGRYVVFESLATNLVPGDTNGHQDIFVRDLQSSTTRRLSLSSGSAQANNDSQLPALSANGYVVAFQSGATNLVAGDANACADTFVRDWTCTGSVSAYCTAKTNSLGCSPSIGSHGLPSQSGPDNFFVTATNVRNNKLGMMLWSLAPDSHPFFGGTLCVHAPIKRTPGQNSGGSQAGNDCTGTYSYHFTQTYMLQQLLGADTTIYAQYWSRDPGFAPPNNIGLTNGLQFTICP